MINISNICLYRNSIFIKFLKILKIHDIFCENPRIIFVLFYDVYKENMFTINLEDGREAPYKASFNKFYNSTNFFLFVFVLQYNWIEDEREAPYKLIIFYIYFSSRRFRSCQCLFIGFN